MWQGYVALSSIICFLNLCRNSLFLKWQVLRYYSNKTISNLSEMKVSTFQQS